MGRVFESDRARRDAAIRLSALLVVAVAAALSVHAFAPSLADPERIRIAVERLGPYAGVAFVGVQAAQVVFAPIPGQTLGVVGGYLFGTLRGAAYSVVGVVVGSTVVFVLARRFGRPYVERVVDDSVLERFDSFVEERGAVGLFVVFLFPAFPDDAVCALAGLTTLRIRTLVALVAVGRVPTFLLVAHVGERAASGRLLAAGSVAAALVALSALIYLGRGKFDAVR
ncbi:TVP38/TMEM64 family protein [Halopelagius fulvigenes]|uniref:TVP38/TMEM64 family protein n=1 Tax=Halopelagius fulvigenes TaxID=1198324 RepID=A0ABD5TUJ3_9EURY